jgi:hypothetical protein
VRRHPVRLGHEKLVAGADVHDGAMKDPAEGAKHIVAIRRRRPLDRVDTERHRGRHRTNGLPPRAQGVGREEAVEDDRRWRANRQVLLEMTFVRIAGLGLSITKVPQW